MTLAVAACGGGGGGDSFAGIDRLGVSSGAITGFGSIFVNGVEWETAGAEIIVDDQPGTESELRVGQVVIIRGSLDDSGIRGEAESVEFDNSVEGPIASINLAAGSFVVLGQTVIVGADTAFDDSIPDRVVDGQRLLSDLLVGDVVEVSGYRDAANAVRATRVEIRTGGSAESEVKGVVSNLNAGAFTFQIGSLVVNYSAAGSVALVNGDFVEVEGTLSGAVLNASKVEIEDDLSGDSGDEGEVEGYITRFVSAADFDVAGIRVITNAGTEFEGGTSADLALNVKVEAEGEVNSSGQIVADKVDIRLQPDDADVEIAGSVAAVNAATGTVTIQGLGVVVTINAATRLEDQSDADLPGFSLANLSPGDYVEIRGAENTTTAAVNDMTALRLERRDAKSEVVLRGPVQAVNEPDLSILGVVVQTDFAEFRSQNDLPIDEATFFAFVGAGDVVKAKAGNANVAGGVMLAEEVEIEELD